MLYNDDFFFKCHHVVISATVAMYSLFKRKENVYSVKDVFKTCALHAAAFGLVSFLHVTIFHCQYSVSSSKNLTKPHLYMRQHAFLKHFPHITHTSSTLCSGQSQTA